MKDSYRLFLFPLKLPKTALSKTSPSSSPKSDSSSPLLSSISSNENGVPIPFLFIHLNKSLTKTANPSIGLNRRSYLARFLNWGEAKWQEYGEAPPRTMKRILHRLGSALLDKIPVTETQLWRLHALHQHLQNGHQSRDAQGALVMETGSSYTTSSTTEQSLRFDLLGQLNSWAAYHRRWSIFSSVLILPMAILSLLPFGKLALAWIIFRAVAHWRAYQGAHFLSKCFQFDSQISHVNTILPVKFVANPTIDRHLPLPPTFSAGTRNFNDPFTSLARDLDLGELANTLPRALQHIIKQESRQLSQSMNGGKRRKFSNQNLLDP